jgi:hypothetical protein
MPEAMYEMYEAMFTECSNVEFIYSYYPSINEYVILQFDDFIGITMNNIDTKEEINLRRRNPFWKFVN